MVSSHSSACGASSLIAKLRIDSRSASCSSVKMKCLRWLLKSGLTTLSAVAMRGRISLLGVRRRTDAGSIGTVGADANARARKSK